VFDVPEEEGDHHYYLYLMCDSYIGLDQQYDIQFTVKQSEGEPAEKTNKNAEVDDEEEDQ